MRKVEWRICRSGGDGSIAGVPRQSAIVSTAGSGNSNGDDGDYRQIDVEIDRFLMVERNLFAFAPGVLFAPGFSSCNDRRASSSFSRPAT